MRSLVLCVVAAATLAVTVPAYAQVEIRAGERGVGVRLGDRDHERGWRRDHVRGAYARGSGCREVTVRKTLPNRRSGRSQEPQLLEFKGLGKPGPFSKGWPAVIEIALPYRELRTVGSIPRSGCIRGRYWL